MAVERIEKALGDGERITIYGDYDVDGTTAVALVYSFLSHLSSEVQFYIPDRYSEGYGISFKGIDRAEEDGVSSIIALDCGIKSIDKVQYATERGIDFIICDHHLPGDELPAAVAVLRSEAAGLSVPVQRAQRLRHRLQADAGACQTQRPALVGPGTVARSGGR